MTANTVISRTEYQKRISNNNLTELENLTKTNNIQSEKYTYYRCECVSKLSLRTSQIIVAVWDDNI